MTARHRLLIYLVYLIYRHQIFERALCEIGSSPLSHFEQWHWQPLDNQGNTCRAVALKLQCGTGLHRDCLFPSRSGNNYCLTLWIKLDGPRIGKVKRILNFPAVVKRG